MACDGRFDSSPRRCAASWTPTIPHREDRRLDALVAEAAAPFAALITRLQTIPGIGQRPPR